MIRRCDDIAFFNEVSNHPSVRPHVLPEGHKSCFIDLEPAFTRLGAIGLCSDYGGFVLIPNKNCPWILDAHGMWLPQEHRAERALHDTAEALKWVFGQPRWDQVVIPVPISSSLRGTGKLLTAAGFQMVGGDKFHDFYRIFKQAHSALLKKGFYDTMFDYSE